MGFDSLPPVVALKRPEHGVLVEGLAAVPVEQLAPAVAVVVGIAVARDVVVRVGPDEELGEGSALGGHVGGTVAGLAQRQRRDHRGAEAQKREEEQATPGCHTLGRRRRRRHGRFRPLPEPERDWSLEGEGDACCWWRRRKRGIH